MNETVVQTMKWYDGGDGVTYEIWQDEYGNLYHVPIEIVRDFGNADRLTDDC